MKSENLSSVDSTESSQSISRKCYINILTEEILKHDFLDLGLNLQQVADKYGCVTSVVKKYIRRYNLPIYFRCADKVTKEQLEDDLYVNYLTLEQMSSKYGFSIDVIRNTIKKYGLPNISTLRLQRLGLEGLQLTPKQVSIVIGSILGDGYICKLAHVATRNAILQISQKASRKEYLFWKAEELSPFIRTTHIFVGGNYTAETYALPILNKFYDMFWVGGKGGRKIVPMTIVDYLDEIALSIFYQDDGSTGKSESIISTCNFTIEENNILADALKDRYDINAKIESGKYPRMHFSKSEQLKLHKIIDPLFHPCFEYKKLINRASETTSKAPITS